MHAKFGRRREHARGAPLLQNHIPAKDRVNVMHDQPQKYLYNRGRAAPYYIASPEVEQTTVRPIIYHLPISFWANGFTYHIKRY